MLHRMIRWLDKRTPLESFLLVFAVLAAVYAPTATWSGAINVDAEASAVPAWQLATTGNLYVEHLPWNPWFVDVGAHRVSNRPLGAILWAVPFYLLFGSAGAPTVWPSTVAALMATSLAMGFLLLGIRRITTPALAFFATLALGLGTATWPISSDQLWAHGPGQMWVALGMLALASDRSFASGLALGAGVLTRPPREVGPAHHNIVAARGGIPATIRPCQSAAIEHRSGSRADSFCAAECLW